MSDPKLPEDRRYAKSHEWVQAAGDLVVVGITDHAQSEMTDIVFVNLPKPGAAVTAGASALSLESVKTVADVYAPVTGTVAESNGELAKHPEWINQDPYGKGWIVKIRPATPFRPETLLDAAGYRASLAHG